MFVIYVTLTCPSFLEVFRVVILSERHIESLRPRGSEAPLILGPAGKILLITEEKAVQKTHQAAGVLPHFTTQLLESQVLNNKCVVIHHFRKSITSNVSDICCVGVFSCMELIHLPPLFITALSPA